MGTIQNFYFAFSYLLRHFTVFEGIKLPFLAKKCPLFLLYTLYMPLNVSLIKSLNKLHRVDNCLV